MADSKITQLTQHTSVINSDLLPVVDITAIETKKLAVGTLRDFITQGVVSSTETGSFVVNSQTSSFVTNDQTGSFVTNDQTGSFYLSSSVNNDTITFNKGNGTQDQVTVNNVSNAFTATTASFAFTASAFHVTVTDEPVTSNIVFVHTNSATVETQEAKIDYALTYNPSINQLTVPNLNVTAAFTSSLAEGYMWVGNSAGITQQISTGSFVTSEQTGSFITSEVTSSFISSSYISAYSTNTQRVITSGSAQIVSVSNIWTQKGVSMANGGTRYIMEKPGIYKFTFTGQVANDSNSTQDAIFWINYNGSVFPNSTTRTTLQPRKSSGEPSAQTLSIAIVGVNTVENGYIELHFTGDDTGVHLKQYPAVGGIPATPSIISNIIRVG